MVRSPRKKPKGVLPEPPRKQWGKQWGGWKLVFTGVAMVVVIGLLVLSSVQSQSPSTVPIAQQPVSSPAASAPVTRTELVRVDLRPVETLEELLALTPQERAEVDVARANLLVAKSSPGGEAVNIEATLEMLDAWAQAVAFDTNRHLYKFHADPGNFENSEGYFRMLSLITVLQQDAGVVYNPERINEPDFTNPADLFIHGMCPVDGTTPSGGTCVSMPVLYTAIARRLGYPVHLVTTKAHVFARWDDGKGSGGERFNIEGSGQGMGSYDDEHYKTWPMPTTEQERIDCGYLKNLEPDEELAIFVANKGHIEQDTGRGSAALSTYQQAIALDPDNRLYQGYFVSLGTRLDALPAGLGGRDRRIGDRQQPNHFDQIREIQELNRQNQRQIGSYGVPDGP